MTVPIIKNDKLFNGGLQLVIVKKKIKYEILKKENEKNNYRLKRHH
jgi:hypothetical protein